MPENALISLGPLDPARDTDALEQASTAQFGRNSYQHLERYMDWLYRSNPAGRGFGDCLVARQEGAIVGCMHRMILPLAGPGSQGVLAVLHNHFVQDTVRAGAGVLLLRRAVKDAQAGFAPGVQAPLDEIYRRLGFQELPASWLVRTLSPVAAAFQLASARLRKPPTLRIDVARLQRRFGDLTISGNPDQAAIDTLCAAMRMTLAQNIGVDWTPALVRWRYFDPMGPRHLWIAGKSGNEWAVISLGRRQGVVVTRLLDIAAGASESFVKRVMRVARSAGASVALCFATSQATVELLQTTKWKVRDNDTFSFRTEEPPIALGAGASDVGFEALLTEFG
jgi:hypothetical protein